MIRFDEFLPDNLFLDRVLYFFEISLQRDKRIGREILGVLLDFHRYVRAFPEIFLFLAVFGGEEIHEGSIEYVQERRDIGVFLALECNPADISFLDQPVIFLLFHPGDFYNVH